MKILFLLENKFFISDDEKISVGVQVWPNALQIHPGAHSY
jgi:hypothetical protein